MILLTFHYKVRKGDIPAFICNKSVEKFNQYVWEI